MKLLTIFILIAIGPLASLAQGKAYKCIPCGLDCDTKTFGEGGKCPDCNMDLQEVGTFNIRWASPSPDHKRLLFTNDATGEEFIHVSSIDGTDSHPLTRGTSPQWSPDGARILFTDSTSIAIIDAGGANRTVVTDKFKGEEPQTPSWGPDANSILFAQGKFPNVNIYRMSLRDYKPVALTSGNGLKYAPSPSPDGKKIAYTQMRKGVVIVEEGKEPVVLAPGGEYARWSPDGRTIAFQKQINGKFVIATVSVSGGEPVILTDGLHDDELPVWSKDGQKIYFQSNRRKGNWEMFAMSADGKQQQLVLGNPEP